MSANRWAALLIIAFGAAYLWGATLIRESTTYAAVGPRFFPNAIGIGIVLSGIWLFLMPGPPPEPDAPQLIPLDWLSIGLMFALVVGYILIFKRVGYILSTTLLMLIGAQILGDRGHLLRDAIIAVLMAVTINFVFARLLGINLPEGLIGF